MFANNPDFPVQLTAQDEFDMVAYLKLLRWRRPRAGGVNARVELRQRL
jgi:hypothetical protein